MNTDKALDSRRRVYFAEACGKIKIGCSVNPTARIAQATEWIPFPVTLLATMPGGFQLERALHNMFCDEWSHAEWFHASDRLIEFIARVAAGSPVVVVKNENEDQRRENAKYKKRVTRLFNCGKINPPAHVWAEYTAIPQGHPVPAELRALLTPSSEATAA